MDNTFVVSDESKNCYGQVILTDGIDTTQFEKNPVMLYMHERKTVVGRWENIRKEGKKLLADAVFDDGTELGATVKRQVEKGFLRSASIGVEIKETKDVKGVEVVTKCELLEVSIVDIPANSNAMKLCKENGRRLLRLAVPERKDDLRNAVIKALGLPADTPDSVIFFELEMLQTLNDTSEGLTDKFIQAGLLKKKEKRDVLQLARTSPAVFKSFMESKGNEYEKKICDIVEQGTKSGRLHYNTADLMKEVGLCLGVEKLSRLIEYIPRSLRVMDCIDDGIHKLSRENWNLTDYRRYAPDELRNNPALYAALQEQHLKKTGETRTLEYYRKHDPDFLRTHPDVYERLRNKN